MNQHPIEFFKNHNLVPRQQQQDVLDEVYKNWDKYNYFAFSLPVGVGKTYIATSIADTVGTAYILTSTLQLQNQYEKSWNEIVNLKGRSNYQCGINSNFTVDAAPCTVNKNLLSDCIKRSCCPYYNQKKLALKAKAMITNPVYMLYSTHCGFAKDEDQPWVKRDVLIIDEAHNIENHLISFAESDVDPVRYRDEFGCDTGHYVFTDDNAANYKIIEKIRDSLLEKAEELKQQLKDEFPISKFTDVNVREWAKGFTAKAAERAKRINFKIYTLDKVIQPLKIFFNTHSNGDELVKRWLIKKDSNKNVIKLSPIYGNFLFHEYFGTLADKFVFLSATLGTKSAFCKELGINQDDIFYVETNSPFPPEKSPVISIPAIKLSKSHYNANIEKVGNLVDGIMTLHESQRGLIHAITYDLQKHIYNGVSPLNRKRLLCRDMDILKGGNSKKLPRKYTNNELLEKHETGTKTNTVLLSPSMMEGVDLHDDLSEFQIIIKLPWANLGDTRISVKSQLDNEWYVNKMWVNVLQASGRSTRHELDSSVTYILDANFKVFYRQWEHKLPEWFKKRIIFESD